ncbi:MAG: M48 family metalloprotease [Pseudomonadota bacterium]|nr:M48 family metalloprotease [Pseudomonadota bacterium]
MKTTKSLWWIRRLALILSAVVVCVSAPVPQVNGQQFTLPDFGSSADLVMSATEERRLGKAFMQSVRASLPVIDDPLLTDYLETLGNRLVAASGTGSGRYTFFFIDESTINAFAGPDGYIGVFSGLVLASQSESELAAVMAHEIAHVTQRHLMRSFEDQQRMSLPATAALIAAAILGAQVDSNLGAAALAGIQAAATQRQINFTRENEKEADRVGISTLAAADFDPYAMPGFFERLSKASRTYENNAPEFLRTHPVTTNRIADALGRANGYGHKQRPDDLRFHLVRARLREISYSRPEKAIAHFRSTLQGKRYRDESAEHYGYALALARDGQIGSAREQTNGLLAEHPNQPEFLILDAQLDVKSGKGADAARKLRTNIGLRPSNVPLRVAYAEALMAAGQPSQALATLEEVVRRSPGNAFVYKLMSDAAGKSGRKATTHRYRAEYHYAQGDLEPAIRQLEIALKKPGLSFHEASKVQVRLDAFREEQEEIKRAR